MACKRARFSGRAFGDSAEGRLEDSLRRKSLSKTPIGIAYANNSMPAAKNGDELRCQLHGKGRRRALTARRLFRLMIRRTVQTDAATRSPRTVLEFPGLRPGMTSKLLRYSICI